MSLSILVHCPHCHAEGNLADPTLFGQAISCPVCQQVFVAPTPTAAVVEPAVTIPAVAEVAAVPTPAPELTSIPTAQPLTGLPEPVATATIDGLLQTAPVPASTMFEETVLALPPIGISPHVEPGGAIPVAQPWGAEPIPTVVAIPIVAAPSATIATPFPPEAFASGVSPAPQVPLPNSAPSTGVFTGQASGQPVFPAAGEDFLAPVGQTFDGPLPQFMAPPPPPGAAEVSFAQSLPEPVARGAVQPPKIPSKTVMRFAIGSVSLIVVVATVVFLLGDPLRKVGKDTKPKGPEEMNPIARPFKPEQGGGDSMEDAIARMKALQSGGQSGKENR